MKEKKNNYKQSHTYINMYIQNVYVWIYITLSCKTLIACNIHKCNLITSYFNLYIYKSTTSFLRDLSIAGSIMILTIVIPCDGTLILISLMLKKTSAFP